MTTINNAWNGLWITTTMHQHNYNKEQWTMNNEMNNDDNNNDYNIYNDNKQWQQCNTMYYNNYNEIFILIPCWQILQWLQYCALFLQHCNAFYNIVMGIVGGLVFRCSSIHLAFPLYIKCSVLQNHQYRSAALRLAAPRMSPSLAEQAL